MLAGLTQFVFAKIPRALSAALLVPAVLFTPLLIDYPSGAEIGSFRVMTTGFEILTPVFHCVPLQCAPPAAGVFGWLVLGLCVAALSASAAALSELFGFARAAPARLFLGAAAAAALSGAVGLIVASGAAPSWGLFLTGFCAAAGAAVPAVFPTSSKRAAQTETAGPDREADP